MGSFGKNGKGRAGALRSEPHGAMRSADILSALSDSDAASRLEIGAPCGQGWRFRRNRPPQNAEKGNRREKAKPFGVRREAKCHAALEAPSAIQKRCRRCALPPQSTILAAREDAGRLQRLESFLSLLSLFVADTEMPAPGVDAKPSLPLFPLRRNRVRPILRLQSQLSYAKVIVI